MFRKHKGKFAAGSRNRYQSGNVPQTPQKKKKAWKWVLLTILLILLALIAFSVSYKALRKYYTGSDLVAAQG